MVEEAIHHSQERHGEGMGKKWRKSKREYNIFSKVMPLLPQLLKAHLLCTYIRVHDKCTLYLRTKPATCDPCFSKLHTQNTIRKTNNLPK